MSQEEDYNLNGAHDGSNIHQPQSQVVPHPLQHMQALNNMNPPSQSSLIDNSDLHNSNSLVYDRTIKVAKTGYADHGSHGVAAFPLENNRDIGAFSGGGSAGAGGGMSSVRMQLQMQQMAAMLQQQQQQQQQQQEQQGQLISTSQEQQQQQPYQMNQMLPPPPNNSMAAGVVGGGYPSLVPGSMGSQLYQLNNNNAIGGDAPGSAPGPQAGGEISMMNTTSSGLMQALNAQMAANQHQQAATNGNKSMGGGNALASTAVNGSGGTINNTPLVRDLHGNPIMTVNNSNLASSAQAQMAHMNTGNLSNISNLNSHPNSGSNGSILGIQHGIPSQQGNMTNQEMIIAPGDIRNGKKRVSPSVPLHPSQLQSHHGGVAAGVPGVGVGGMGSYTGGVGSLLTSNNLVPMSANLGMNTVAEGEEGMMSNSASLNSITGQQLKQQLLQPQQVLKSNSAAGMVNQALAAQGLLGAALDQTQGGFLTQQPQAVTNCQPGLAQPPVAKKQSPQKQAAVAKLSSQQLDEMEGRVGEVLTNPSVPSANSGLDNAEGNLIVRRGDILRIPRRNMHSHPPGSSSSGASGSSDLNTTTSSKESKTAKGNGNRNNNGDNLGKEADKDEIVEYRVISLLGQGTFAQVFHCIDLKSRKSVAVKIVKNKPAYTRQAAVEIDVFRKLNSRNVEDEDGGSSDDTLDGNDRASGESATSGDNAKAATATKGSHSTSCGSSYSSYESSSLTTNITNSDVPSADRAIIRLMHYFMHSSHLCLVFEMLGPNLYELLKKRQFRGLPIGAVRTLVRQATEGIKLLGRRNVVHCDLKPENILMVRSDVEGAIQECKAKGDKLMENNSSAGRDGRSSAQANYRGINSVAPSKEEDSDDDDDQQWIKLIDFGSACFEGQTTHTYIQSRFYRSPEVLVGLPYDSAIDVWSLGCVAAELFLGLPILPGVHEHDQLGRMLEMIGPMPDWMLEQGSKSGKFFKKRNNGIRSGNNHDASSHSFGPPSGKDGHHQSSSAQSSSWEFKTRQEYIAHLTEEEKRSKGGLSKLEQQQTNRYFKKKRLEDIVMHHGVCNTKKERERLGLFVHFLKGVLDPDPWKRWTAHQASMHPFLTGSSVYRIKANTSDESSGVKPYDIHWVPPWDASISRRKLMIIQKTKEKAAAAAAAAQAQQQAAQQQAAVAAANSSRRRLSLNDNRSAISQSVPESSAVAQSVPHHHLPHHLSIATQGLDMYGSPLKSARNKLLDIQQPSPSAVSVTSQMAAMADAMSLERARSNISNISGRGSSPPQNLLNGGLAGGVGQLYHHPGAAYPSVLSASLGGVGIPLSYQQLADLGQQQQNLVGRSFSENMVHPADAQLAAMHQQQQQQMQASLSGLNDVAFLQPPPPPPPTFVGAQSFSGAYGYHQPMPGAGIGGQHPYHMESELGYALQRPGVVPGMGNDAAVAAAFAGAALRRQSSSNNALLAAAQQQQQNQMLSASLSNLSSSATPGGPMGYQQSGMVSMSPGGLLLQKLGLQEQMLGNQSHYNAASGGVGGTSLLAQQLEEYSQADQHQQQMQGQQQQQHPQVMHNQQTFSSSGMTNPGSYHGGYDPSAAPTAVPMSLTSLPYNMQSASFSDFGNTSAHQHNSATPSQMQQAFQHAQLRMNASFPAGGQSNNGNTQQQQMMMMNNGQFDQGQPSYGSLRR